MRILFFGFSFLLSSILFAQTTVNGSYMHNGINRSYSFYVPAIYNGSVAVPLILNLHGYTSNGTEQSFYGNFTAIADTAGFIVVHPEGTLQSGTTSTQFWNVGFFPSTVDDVGFLESLIDTISAHYNINPQRIYSTGMSNGGYMSYNLACNSDRFAAIASVTGSMTTSMFNSCNPSKPTPVMEIHGTADATVPYNGTTGSLSIDQVLNYWASFNNCPVPATMTAVPDIATTDGATAEHYVYSAGNQGVTMEHFKVLNGAHTWPGAIFNIGTTCQDFSASIEIWRFFRQYENPVAGLNEFEKSNSNLSISPNPCSDKLTITLENSESFQVSIFDMNGREQKMDTSATSQISIEHLDMGTYLVVVSTESSRMIQKFIKY